MKHLFTSIILAASLVLSGCSDAFGAAEQKVDSTGSLFPMWVQGGLYVGPRSPNPTNNTQNKTTRILTASSAIDFASTGIGKIESSAITVLGARAGDPCTPGVPVAAGTLKAQYTCYVSASDAAKVVFESIDTSVGTIALTAGSGTASVSSGSTCVCTDTTANASVKCAVASTTLTATGTGTDTIAYICNAPVDPPSGTFTVRIESSQ